MSATRFTIDAIFKATDRFSGPVARMTTRTGKFMRNVKKGMGGIRRTAKRALRGMKQMTFSLATFGVIGATAFKRILEPAVDFQHAIAGINAKTRGAIAAEGRLNEIREKALKLGGATVFTSIQVAEAMQDLAKAGLTTTEILGGIEPILHAAGAESANISDVSKVIVSTMKAFDQEMNLENTTKATDIFANVAAGAKTSILGLAEGVSKFAPVAKMFGFAMSDTIAFVAALQDVGIEESMSGTQMKTMFSKLANLSPKAKKEFKKLGIDVRKSLEAGDAPCVITEIMEGLDRATSNAQKMRAMTSAFGQRGMIASMILAASAGKKSGGLLDLLEKAGPAASGAAAEMYKIQQATTRGAFTELSSAWETFRIRIGSGELPAMKGLADSIANMLRDPTTIENFAGYINSAVSGMKTFWEQNKEFLTSLGAMLGSTIKIGMQLLGAAWQVLAPMRWVVTKMFDLVTVILNMLGRFGDFINDTAFGRMVNKMLWNMNAADDSMGVQVNKVDTTPIAHGGTTHDVVNAHGTAFIRLAPGLEASPPSFDVGQTTFQFQPSGGFNE